MNKELLTCKAFDPLLPVTLPKYAHEGDAGADLFSINQEQIIIKSNEIKLIDTNLAIELPQGYEAQVRSRSGLALKSGIFVLNSPGTIDSNYRGPIGVILANFSKNDFIVEPNMKIAQLVINKVETLIFTLTEDLTVTSRNSNGFGSTGI